MKGKQYIAEFPASSKDLLHTLSDGYLQQPQPVRRPTAATDCSAAHTHRSAKSPGAAAAIPEEEAFPWHGLGCFGKFRRQIKGKAPAATPKGAQPTLLCPRHPTDGN